MVYVFCTLFYKLSCMFVGCAGLVFGHPFDTVKVCHFVLMLLIHCRKDIGA